RSRAVFVPFWNSAPAVATAPQSATTREGTTGTLAAEMAYDEELANRIRGQLANEPGITEKKMFGGLAFLLNGNMTVSASGRGGLLARIDPADTEPVLARPHVARMEMGG